MSLSDTAEYWWDVKAHFNRVKPIFTHIPNLNCGHYHVHESPYLNDITCYACLKLIDTPEYKELILGESKREKNFKKRQKNRTKAIKLKLEKKYPNNPDCPSCGKKMIERTNSNTGERFYGCSNYPNCKQTKPIL